MSGHSKWATTHRQKEIKDAARGKLFSKLARLITIAAKTGGGSDPSSNFKLRDMIEKARIANMPKENIDRAISKAEGGEELEEVLYEGFGPGGVPLLVSALTDNRNRTGQEIKNMLERSGGTLAGPGAVSFQFEKKGYILVQKQSDIDAQALKLIDLGIEDFEIEDEGIVCFVEASRLYQERNEIEKAGFSVMESEIIYKPKTINEISDKELSQKIETFLESLEEHDDVQRVFTSTFF